MKILIIIIVEKTDKETMKCRLHKIVAIIFLGMLVPVFFSDAQTRSVKNVESSISIGDNLDASNNVSLDNYNGALIGTESGLYTISEGNIVPLWTEAPVYKIIRTDEWIFLTLNGIFASSDLITFESRNQGLPFHTIKKYENGEKSFEKQAAELKDLQINPENPKIMATLTRDKVFLTRDGGLTWKNLGFSARTNGAKAVAVCNMKSSTGEDVLTVFMSHSIYGLSWIQPDAKNSKWVDITAGFEMMPSLSSPDEISDILTVRKSDENGNIYTEVFLSQSFMPCLYKLDWEKQRGVLLGRDTEPLDTIDSLFPIGNKLIYVKPDGIGAFNLETNVFEKEPEVSSKWKYISELPGPNPRCLFLPAEFSGFGQPISICELWLLNPSHVTSTYSGIADNKKSLYVPAGQAYTVDRLEPFLKVAEDNKLNSIVIDMKDDYGFLRYISTDPEVKKMGVSSQYAIDLDPFIEKCKEKDIYMVARIVVFKDRSLWRSYNGKYAISDSSTGKPWQGIRRYVQPEEGADITGKVLEYDESGNPTGRIAEFYDEYWVDPYSEEVWAYNVAIAKELISRGFDEVQFDYIRFPTDGTNLYKANYKWRDSGMDMEGALLSFLKYARENIKAPIGIDIYGANGWYRSGARTGQDVEMLSHYVDVICPMFYPSHFEQDFLAYAPAEERAYRVYYYGSYRNAVIARNRVLIRPWLQAFYLNVSYDKKYYDENYVLRQVYGNRDSINRGYMYWNNSGRYSDISPDPGLSSYPWTLPWANSEYKTPALGIPFDVVKE